MASDFETLVGVIHTALNDSSIAWGVFRVEESANSALRNVVWVPTTFETKPVKYAGPLTDPDTGLPVEILYADYVTVECQISGVSFEDACSIRGRVLSAARMALGTSSTPTRGAYLTELEGQSGHLWGGAAKIVQHFVWQLSVALVDPSAGPPFIVEQIVTDNEMHNAADNTVSDPPETFTIPTPP